MNGPASPQMLAFLSVKEVKIKEYFPNFGIYALNLYAGWLPNLALFSEASFIALDKDVQRLGHVSETTGADEVRSNNGTTAFDGNNVGIAVLDSGVDKDHKSFIQGQKNSVALGLDFTGENNIKDPFGHGTHVASAAAATTTLASGRYQGIAPKASIINLRVLNSMGTGKMLNVIRALNWVYQNRTTYNIRVVT